MPKCLNCKKTFKIKFRSSEKYCSPECGMEYRKKLKLKDKEKKYCLVCGKEVTGRQRYYCSKQCCWKAQNDKRGYQPKSSEDYSKPKTKSSVYYSKPKVKAIQREKYTGPSLTEIAVKCRAEGLSYGQYVAKYGL